jgi:hypothetical protein
VRYGEAWFLYAWALLARQDPEVRDPADPRAVALSLKYAAACLAAGDAPEARKELGAAARRLGPLEGRIPEEVAGEAERLAEAFLSAGAAGDAAELFRALHACRRKRLGAASPEARAAEEALARALAALEDGAWGADVADVAEDAEDADGGEGKEGG